jgi:hypothetical protein
MKQLTRALGLLGFWLAGALADTVIIYAAIQLIH